MVNQLAVGHYEIVQNTFINNKHAKNTYVEDYCLITV